MANTVEHSIRLSANNEKLKKVLKESAQILKNNARATTDFSRVVSKGFDHIHNKVKDLNRSLSQMNNTLGGGPGGAGGLLGRLRGLTGLGLAGVGMAAAGAGMALSQRFQTADTGLRLQAIGAGGRFRSNTGLGFTAPQTLEQRLSLTRGVGGTGGGLEGIQALARVTGLDPSEIIGSAATRRQAGMSRGQSLTSVRRTMGILSQTLGETFDKGRLGEFMSSMDQTLMSIGQGVNIDENSFAKAFGNLIRNPTMGASPQRAANALGAIDATLKTASGDRFGMVAQIMQGAMGGNASGIDLMFEARRGLFGQGRLGGRDRSSAIFGSMSNFFQQQGMGGGDQESSRLRAIQLQDYFGIQGIDVAKALGDAIVRGDVTKAAKLSKGFESPESLQKKAIDIMQSTDGGIMTMKALLSNLLDQVGNSIAPNVAKLTSAITGSSIGKSIFGMPSEQMQQIDQEVRDKFRKKGLTSLDVLNKPGFDQDSASIQNMGNLLYGVQKNLFSAEEKKQVQTALQEEIQSGKNRLQDFADNPAMQERITEVIEKLERLASAIEKEKSTNITVQGPRGRPQDIQTKSIGQVR